MRMSRKRGKVGAARAPSTDSLAIRYGMLIALTSTDISGAYIDLEIWRLKNNNNNNKKPIKLEHIPRALFIGHNYVVDYLYLAIFVVTTPLRMRTGL